MGMITAAARPGLRSPPPPAWRETIPSGCCGFRSVRRRVSPRAGRASLCLCQLFVPWVQDHEFESIAQLEGFLSAGRSALISILGDREVASGPCRLERMSPSRGNSIVPILVDAASTCCACRSWLERGADLVVVSVGKFMRGPAATGLLLDANRSSGGIG